MTAAASSTEWYLDLTPQTFSEIKDLAYTNVYTMGDRLTCKVFDKESAKWHILVFTNINSKTSFCEAEFAHEGTWIRRGNVSTFSNRKALVPKTSMAKLLKAMISGEKKKNDLDRSSNKIRTFNLLLQRIK